MSSRPELYQAVIYLSSGHSIRLKRLTFFEVSFNPGTQLATSIEYKHENPEDAPDVWFSLDAVVAAVCTKMKLPA